LSKDHTFYEYNEQGDVSLITIKNKEGEVTETGVVTYKYDDRGNWIERADPSQMAKYSTL
jgi:YD repeat-containing protein